MNKTTLLLIGGAVIVGLFLVFRGNGLNSLAGNPNTSIFGSRQSIIPPAGPNTPFNTSGTAPYKPAAYGAGGPLAGQVGPSVVAASIAGFTGLASSIANLFKPSQQNLPAGPGQAPGYPVGQDPYYLLGLPAGPQPLGPGTAPIPSPIGPGVNYAAVPAPPDIVNPSTSPDYSALLSGIDNAAVAAPSPFANPTDFGAATDVALTNPGYYTDPSVNVVADYASPSYVYDGGELVPA